MAPEHLPTHVRLTGLLDRLGLASAHFATQMPADIAGLAENAPDRIAGLALVVPTRLDPAPFTALAGRLLLLAGDSGATAEVVARARLRLPGARLTVLDGYAATGWADVAAERGEELTRTLYANLSTIIAPNRAANSAPSTPPPIPPSGSHLGLTWISEGQGPALILLPFFLAASQWDPVVSRLARHFTVIKVGGPHVGGVAALEDRASLPSYRAMLGTLIDIAAPRPGLPVLDVGCGSGALSRLLARRLGPATPVTGVDVNAYLMREGRALAEAEGLAGGLGFTEGSAVDLPFPDASFDCVVSVTVLEECNADRAIAEMVRVARPGARIGIIVRAIDMPQWWSLDLDPDLAACATPPPPSIAPGGVADKSLYARMRRAGLERLVPFPALVTLDRPGSVIWRYREDHILSQLDSAQTARWRRASTDAAQTGGLFQSHPMHCAVATKPLG